jgi:hypothetical protein
MSAPRVSVIMTVYRDFRFVDEAVASILNQDFTDLELILVDDGNARLDIFDAIAARDRRIRIVSSAVNIGTAAAANLGIAAAKGEFVARLDADDVSEPGRLTAQVAALDADPDLGLVASAVTLIDEAGAVIRQRAMPETDTDIRWTIHFYNPIYHSTATYRRSVFEAAGRYRPEELVSQDHYLWFEMLPLCRMRNLAEPLVRYRHNGQGLTVTHNTGNPRARTHPIREALWRRLGVDYALHDNALAADINGFLDGADIAPERRLAAYCVLLEVLSAFRRAPRLLPRAGDAGDLRRLSGALVHRMTAMAPVPHADAPAMRRAVWKFLPTAALRLMLRALRTQA